MAASRSISTGALIPRERPHERHDGYTHTDGASEHRGPALGCSFRVVSGLMYRSCQWHTQNEQIIRPHRLCQGLDRGPEPRCPDGGASGCALHHGPHRDSAIEARGGHEVRVVRVVRGPEKPLRATSCRRKKFAGLSGTKSGGTAVCGSLRGDCRQSSDFAGAVGRHALNSLPPAPSRWIHLQVGGTMNGSGRRLSPKHGRYGLSWTI